MLEEYLDRKDTVCIIDEAVANFDVFAHLPFPKLVLPGGDTHKSLATVERIWDFLLEHHITRHGLLICIGGGVITDLGGFAAGTYKRGIEYINIPTTLLAMVDASTGGKTGFNYGGLKNSIGAFCSPKETIIQADLLKTLPAEQILSGFAEMLKTALLGKDSQLWHQLLQFDLDSMNTSALAPLVDECLHIKKSIVEADPKEEGPRKALNFGHTFGHALEENALAENQPILHGYAVLYGLISELYLSITLLDCPREPLQQLTQLMLHYYGRPSCKCKNRDKLITLMQQDKKNEQADNINCTLIRSVGQPVINQIITSNQANEAWDYLFSL